MSIPDSLARLTGDWWGTNHVFLPDVPPHVSDTTMSITTAAQGRFAVMRYTWADEGTPQDGLLIVGHNPGSGGVEAFWVDSWHMDHGQMTCNGAVDEDGTITVSGSYTAPPGPDWGWRIDIVPQSDGGFRLLMFNITPDGGEYPAVEATYARHRA